MKTDRCVVLLDAWDEVPVEVPQNGQRIRYEIGYRQWLGQRLDAFARQFPQPRLLAGWSFELDWTAKTAAKAVEEIMAQDMRIFKLSKLLRKKWEGRSVEELSR